MRRILLALALLSAVLPSCGKGKEERLTEHKTRGGEHLKAGRVDEALLELKGALQLAPNDTDVMKALASAFERKGQYAEAFSALNKVAESKPDDLDVQVRLANLYLLGGGLEEAKRRVEAALARDANIAGAHVVLAGVFAKKGDLNHAISEFDKAIALEPANSDNKLLKATLLMENRRYADSRKVIEEVVAAHADHAGALLLLAQVSDLEGDRKGAEEAFGKILKTRPDDPGVWLNFGNFWLSKREPKKAVDAYRRAAEAAPKATTALERIVELSLEAGDLAGARSGVEEIRSRQPKSALADYYEARIALAEGKPAQAISKLQTVLKEDPNHAESAYFLGVAYFAQGDLQLAKGELNKVLEINPAHARARGLRARVYLDLGDMDHALEDTTELLKRRALDVNGAVVRGIALVRKGQLKAGKAVLEQVVRVQPRAGAAHRELGICYLAEKKPQMALEAFRKALEVEPRKLEPLDLAVKVLLSQRKHREAAAMVEAQAKVAGDSATIHELLGQVLAASGERERARQEFERAVAMNPKAAEAYLAISQLASGPNAVRDGLAALDKALAANPKLLQAWLLKGSLHDRAGEFDAANKAYRRALEIDPEALPALNNLAWNLAEHGGNVDEALKFAEKAVELSPRMPVVNDTLGWIYVKKAVYGKAASHLEPAVQAMPKSPAVHYHLGKAYEGMGDRKKAVASLRKALGLSRKFPGSDDAEKTLRELEGKKG